MSKKKKPIKKYDKLLKVVCERITSLVHHNSAEFPTSTLEMMYLFTYVREVNARKFKQEIVWDAIHPYVWEIRPGLSTSFQPWHIKDSRIQNLVDVYNQDGDVIAINLTKDEAHVLCSNNAPASGN